MPDGSALLAGAVALAFVPVLWSGLIGLVHHGRAADARVEPAVLGLMLAPFAVAVVFLAGFSIVPLSAPQGTLEIVPLGAFLPPSSAVAGRDWTQVALLVLAGIYGGRTLWGAAALALEQWRYRRIAMGAAPSDRPGVLIADMQVPAFARARVVVLSRRLGEVFTPQEIAMVVAHERAHIARRDPRLYAVLAWIDVLVWFNPFVRRQTRKCRLAAEVACDAAVVAAAPRMRKTYAATIVAVLRHAAGSALACAPAAISPRNLGDHGMRIAEIMTPSPRPGKRTVAYALAAVLALPAGLLQVAYAQAASGNAPFMKLPLAGPITAPYGDMLDPFDGKARFHNGVDIMAQDGVEILAPAPGKVTLVVLNDKAYGNVLEIDHGNGLVTRYAHLKDVSVAGGAQVAAGQVIAHVGSTGRSTGPHLHLQVMRNGKAVNPAEVFKF